MRHSLLGTVGAVALAAAMSTTGAKEARADCSPFFFSTNVVTPSFLNCQANATNGLDLDFFNAGAGFFNGSGNANSNPFGSTHGPEFNLQVFNNWLGIANGSGNANAVLTGDLDFNPQSGGAATTNISAFNFEAGIANGSGNANVIIAQPFGCTADDDDDDDHCTGTTATNIQVGNTYFGALNGALNGNSTAPFDTSGSTSTFVLEAENFGNGIGNLSGNANSVGSCTTQTRADDSTGPALDSAGDNQTQSTTDNGKSTTRTICNNTGDTSAIIANNQAFGNLNGSGNGNALGGVSSGTEEEHYASGTATVIETNNHLFGNVNAAGNGNAFGNGGNGYADVENNFISGNFSGTGNGNGYNGSATIVDNRVMGDGSLSNNGNAPDPSQDGYADLENNTVIGNNSMSYNAKGTYKDNIVMGDYSADGNQDGFSHNAIIGSYSGNGAAAGAQNNVVMGNYAGNNLGGNNNVAIGTGAGNSLGNDDTAIGARAQVTADHSTALGADAVATMPNQMSFGTTSDTYTASGITSSLSRSRQSGPLQVVTSDANGNLATDGGNIFRRLDENAQGVALALAAVNPDLTGNEHFGITANWGGFDGANAFGMGFEGVVGHGWLMAGSRAAITGGWGVGFADGNGSDVFGGRVGGQLTW